VCKEAVETADDSSALAKSGGRAAAAANSKCAELELELARVRAEYASAMNMLVEKGAKAVAEANTKCAELEQKLSRAKTHVAVAVMDAKAQAVEEASETHERALEASELRCTETEARCNELEREIKKARGHAEQQQLELQQELGSMRGRLHGAIAAEEHAHSTHPRCAELEMELAQARAKATEVAAEHARDLAEAKAKEKAAAVKCRELEKLLAEAQQQAEQATVAYSKVLVETLVGDDIIIGRGNHTRLQVVGARGHAHPLPPSLAKPSSAMPWTESPEKSTVGEELLARLNSLQKAHDQANQAFAEAGIGGVRPKEGSAGIPSASSAAQHAKTKFLPSFFRRDVLRRKGQAWQRWVTEMKYSQAAETMASRSTTPVQRKVVGRRGASEKPVPPGSRGSRLREEARRLIEAAKAGARNA
jgi:hypothetical protein